MSTEITNHPNPSPEVPQETNRLPVVAMRGVVVFPGMTIHFDLVRETFLHALRAGMGKDRRVILVAQKDAIVEDPKPEDFYTVGVIADLRQVMRTPSGVTRVLAEGKTRISVSDFQKEADDYWTAAYDTLEEIEISPEEKNEEEALGRCIKASFQRYAELLPQTPEEMAAAIFCEKDIKKLFEQIVFNLAYDYTEKQLLLEENSWLERLRKLYQLMTDELDILTLERQIQAETQESIDTSQRDYYLREQQRLIAGRSGRPRGGDGNVSGTDPEASAG